MKTLFLTILLIASPFTSNEATVRHLALAKIKHELHINIKVKHVFRLPYKNSDLNTVDNQYDYFLSLANYVVKRNLQRQGAFIYGFTPPIDGNFVVSNSLFNCAPHDGFSSGTLNENISQSVVLMEQGIGYMLGASISLPHHKTIMSDDAYSSQNASLQLNYNSQAKKEVKECVR